MEQNKKWCRTEGRKSELRQNGIELASIDREEKNGRVGLQIGSESYSLKLSGFMGQKLELFDASNNPVLTVEAEKWYSKTYTFNYGGHTYQLLVRNNPLAEFVILDTTTEYLAYGLDFVQETKKTAVRINEKDHQPIIFHALLWYLFEPIAIENTVDFQWWVWGM